MLIHTSPCIKINPSRKIQSAIHAQMLLKLIDVSALHQRREKLSPHLQPKGGCKLIAGYSVTLHAHCLGSHTPNLLALSLAPWRANPLRQWSSRRECVQQHPQRSSRSRCATHGWKILNAKAAKAKLGRERLLMSAEWAQTFKGASHREQEDEPSRQMQIYRRIYKRTHLTI